MPSLLLLHHYCRLLICSNECRDAASFFAKTTDDHAARYRTKPPFNKAWPVPPLLCRPPMMDWPDKLVTDCFIYIKFILYTGCSIFDTVRSVFHLFQFDHLSLEIIILRFRRHTVTRADQHANGLESLVSVNTTFTADEPRAKAVDVPLVG